MVRERGRYMTKSQLFIAYQKPSQNLEVLEKQIDPEIMSETARRRDRMFVSGFRSTGSERSLAAVTIKLGRWAVSSGHLDRETSEFDVTYLA